MQNRQAQQPNNQQIAENVNDVDYRAIPLTRGSQPFLGDLNMVPFLINGIVLATDEERINGVIAEIPPQRLVYSFLPVVNEIPLIVRAIIPICNKSRMDSIANVPVTTLVYIVITTPYPTDSPPTAYASLTYVSITEDGQLVSVQYQDDGSEFVSTNYKATKALPWTTGHQLSYTIDDVQQNISDALFIDDSNILNVVLFSQHPNTLPSAEVVMWNDAVIWDTTLNSNAGGFRKNTFGANAVANDFESIVNYRGLLKSSIARSNNKPHGPDKAVLLVGDDVTAIASITLNNGWQVPIVYDRTQQLFFALNYPVGGSAATYASIMWDVFPVCSGNTLDTENLGVPWTYKVPEDVQQIVTVGDYIYTMSQSGLTKYQAVTRTVTLPSGERYEAFALQRIPPESAAYSMYLNNSMVVKNQMLYFTTELDNHKLFALSTNRRQNTLQLTPSIIPGVPYFLFNDYWEGEVNKSFAVPTNLMPINMMGHDFILSNYTAFDTVTETFSYMVPSMTWSESNQEAAFSFVNPAKVTSVAANDNRLYAVGHQILFSPSYYNVLDAFDSTTALFTPFIFCTGLIKLTGNSQTTIEAIEIIFDISLETQEFEIGIFYLKDNVFGEQGAEFIENWRSAEWWATKSKKFKRILNSQKNISVDFRFSCYNAYVLIFNFTIDPNLRGKAIIQSIRIRERS